MASSNLAVRTRDGNDARREDADREEQNFICEWHFKAECVLTGKLNCCSLCLLVSCSVNY